MERTSPPPLDDIAPPSNVAREADAETRKGISDFTAASAHHRVLYINAGFFKYGTNDKAHAAAIVLCMALLLAMILLIFFGTRGGDAEWNGRAFAWLSNAFLFAAGVALEWDAILSNRTLRSHPALALCFDEHLYPTGDPVLSDDALGRSGIERRPGEWETD